MIKFKSDFIWTLIQSLKCQEISLYAVFYSKLRCRVNKISYNLTESCKVPSGTILSAWEYNACSLLKWDRIRRVHVAEKMTK